MTPPTLETVLRVHDGRPLRGCPGRYVLRAPGPRDGPAVIVGGEAPTTRHHPDGVRDEVALTWLESWGLISYRRTDGTWLHTANTPEGFRRKLAMLGLDGRSGDAAL